jgi:hypothetical protein
MKNGFVAGVSEEFISDVAVKVKELMKNNMNLPFKDKVESNGDKEHLEFIYGRLIEVYQERDNVDYMIRFKKIIDKYED